MQNHTRYILIIRTLFLMVGVFYSSYCYNQDPNNTTILIQDQFHALEVLRVAADWSVYDSLFSQLINNSVSEQSEKATKRTGILKEIRALRDSMRWTRELDFVLTCFQKFPLGAEENDFLLKLLQIGLKDLAVAQNMEPHERLHYSLQLPFDYADWRKKNGYYQEAIDTMERVKNRMQNLTPEEKWPEASDPFLLHCYNILGGIYADLGMYPIAISYNDLYLELLKDNPHPWNKVLTLGRKGVYLLRMGNTAQSQQILEEAVRICEREYPTVLADVARQGKGLSKRYTRYTSRLKGIYRDLASVYMATGRMELADEMLRVAEAIPILHSEDVLLEASYRAEFLEQTNNISEAVQVLSNALTSVFKSLDAQTESLVVGDEISLRMVMKVGLGLAHLQQQTGDLQAAGLTLDQLERELKKLSPDQHMNGINIAVERVRLQLLSYSHQPDPDALDQILTSVVQTQSMILGYQATTTDDASKLHLNKAGRELFGLGLSLASLMPTGEAREEVALQHAEAGRAVLLDQALRFQRADQFPGIPDSLQDQMKLLSALIEGYELGLKLDPTPSRNNQSNLARHREDKRRLAIRLKKEFPESYRQTMVRQLPNVPQLQRILPKGSGIFSLALHDTLIFAQLITRQVSELRRIRVPADFRKSILQFLVELKTSRQDDLDSPKGRAFAKNARAYYKILFEPFESILPQRLLIVPDGPLAFIPFDCLLTADPPPNAAWDNLPYQIRKRALSVHFSIGSWLAEEQKPIPEFKYKWAGFAPDFPIPLATRMDQDPNRDFLVKLLYNKQEIQQVGEIFQGEYFLDEQATLPAFRNVAGQSSIIHLSTHAKANDQQGDHCFIAFSNASQTGHHDPGDTLLAAEIYSLRIPAELLILSACETGVGEVKDGEGMIGLHHAFTHAGVKSILSTLWTVDDESMSDLMVSFATSLSEGDPKDIALQSAKLEFLNDRPSRSHPFYWAAPVLQGNLQPLQRKFNWPIWIAGFGLLLGLVLWGRHRHRSYS